MERLDRFMARANATYYATRDPFQDFTTAPEITQVFGELLGAWAAVAWSAMGSPPGVKLIELGPGRGTLMRDALRAIGQVAPALRSALSLHLVETSPRLRVLQRDLLPEAMWHDRAADVPPGPAIVLANEFLDALPIRQFVRRGTSWSEVWVADGARREQPADPPLPDMDVPEGTVIEWNAAAQAEVAALAARLAGQGGAALLLDYGPAESGPGDTLQALRDGRPADPLQDQGSADLTAHVDFAALARVARRQGAAVHGPVPQGMFLVRLGLFQRTGRLARGQPPARAAGLVQAAQRLAEPSRMGRLFNSMAICHPHLPTPPGFEDA